jgi:uncharacterized phiE125 gp8 family phage protein
MSGFYNDGPSIILGVPQPPSSGLTPYRSVVRVERPVVEPVSLAMAKKQCRVDTEADDEYIAHLIAVARQYVEDTLDITLLTTTWEARYDIFPTWEINLPRPPLQNKTITVTYRPGDGNYYSLSSAAAAFQWDHRSTPGRIFPLWASAWPPVRGDENSVVVRYTAGYGDDGTACPPEAKHLIMLLVAHWYDSRQPVAPGAANPVPLTVETLMASSGLGIYR